MSPPARRTVALAWLALAVLTTLPYVAAARWPPAGTRFTGALFYVDDLFQYLSFAEQAGRGAFLFVNKFDPRPQEPFLVNLEWWAAGRISALAGGHPWLGFHVLRLGALAALLAASGRALTRAGREPSGLVWTLILVATGGGLGWLRLWQGAPGAEIPDIAMGFYPWHQALFNPHFLVGTALLTWTLLLHLDWRLGMGRRWPWIACAWVAGLSRPYDLAAFVGIAFLATLLDRHAGLGARWGAVADLIWVAPVFAYYALLVGAHPAFAGWGGQALDPTPPATEVLLALGPPLLLIALLLFRRRPAFTGPAAAGILRTVAVWGVVLTALVLLWRAPMAKQLSTSVGAALLLGLALLAPVGWRPLVALGLAPTSLFLFWRALNPFLDSFAPLDDLAATDVLASACSPGQLVIAPPSDLGLMIAGFTPCRVTPGHRLLAPHYAAAVEAARRFYDRETTPAWRVRLLRDAGATFVAMPGNAEGLLGPAPPFHPILVRPGLEVWATTPP